MCNWAWVWVSIPRTVIPELLQLVPNTKITVIIKKERFIDLSRPIVEQFFLPDKVHSINNSMEMELCLSRSLLMVLHEVMSLSQCYEICS